MRRSSGSPTPSMRRPVMSRHSFAFFFPGVCSHSAKPPLSPSFHPHSFVSDIRSVLGGCSRFSRCCYLIIVLSSHRFCGSWAPGLSRSHLDSAVELSCSDRNSLAPLGQPEKAMGHESPIELWSPNLTTVLLCWFRN